MFLRKPLRWVKELVVKGLSPSQKQAMKDLLSPTQLDMLRRLLNHSSKEHWQIEQLKYKLLSLGIYERAEAELLNVASDSNPTLKNEANKALALYYADQYSEVGARKCLEHLDKIDQKDDPDLARQIAIMKAESLNLLGSYELGEEVITHALRLNPHPDLYLAMANLKSSSESKVDWINKAMGLYRLHKISMRDTAGDLYDSLKVELVENIKEQTMPKLTVIMPVYNAASFIRTALDAVINQTWSNLEIIVVDDCSTDETARIVQEYKKKDSRIQLIMTEANRGPYVARNIALQQATGDYVTCHDADDWSHPEKLATQITHLIRNKKVIGNTSQQARATSELQFYRRGKFGSYVFANMSSFMFRREPVLKAIGYWDCVRFGADSEFIRRIRNVFGEWAIIDLETGPLSFQRQSSNSLTGDSVFGYPGYFMGARKEYFDSFTYFHSTASSLHYTFPQSSRAFAVPEPLWPNREEKRDGYRHFDVIIASDFRLDVGSLCLEKIRALNRRGLRTGLVQISCYSVSTSQNINPQIRDVINNNKTQMIVYGENILCKELIVYHLPVLQDIQMYIPNIKPDKVHVIINHIPSDMLYDMKQYQRHLELYFGQKGTWYPLDSTIRKKLIHEYAEQIRGINLSHKDWN